MLHSQSTVYANASRKQIMRCNKQGINVQDEKPKQRKKFQRCLNDRFL
jgi:hypothetical protein